MPDADKGASQPDPTRSVSDEIERRRETGPQQNKAPDVKTEFCGQSSKAEAESDKPWSRKAGEVQEREVKREGTAASGSQSPEG